STRGRAVYDRSRGRGKDERPRSKTNSLIPNRGFGICVGIETLQSVDLGKPVCETHLCRGRREVLKHDDARSTRVRLITWMSIRPKSILVESNPASGLGQHFNGVAIIEIVERGADIGLWTEWARRKSDVLRAIRFLEIDRPVVRADIHGVPW